MQDPEGHAEEKKNDEEAEEDSFNLLKAIVYIMAALIFLGLYAAVLFSK